MAGYRRQVHGNHTCTPHTWIMSLSLQVILHDVLKFLFVYILFLLGFGVGNCFTTNSNAHACKAPYPDSRMTKHTGFIRVT